MKIVVDNYEILIDDEDEEIFFDHRFTSENLRGKIYIYESRSCKNSIRKKLQNFILNQDYKIKIYFKDRNELNFQKSNLSLDSIVKRNFNKSKDINEVGIYFKNFKNNFRKGYWIGTIKLNGKRIEKIAKSKEEAIFFRNELIQKYLQ